MSSCGDCRVCCEVLGFTGKSAHFDKYKEAESFGVIFDAWSPCNKLCSVGCSIHHDKPKICSEFYCSYITEDLLDKYWPAKCGFVAYVNEESNALFIISKNRTLPIDIYYNNNKNLIDGFVEEVLVSLARRYEVILMSEQGSLFI